MVIHFVKLKVFQLFRHQKIILIIFFYSGIFGNCPINALGIKLASFMSTAMNYTCAALRMTKGAHPKAQWLQCLLTYVVHRLLLYSACGLGGTL